MIRSFREADFAICPLLSLVALRQGVYLMLAWCCAIAPAALWAEERVEYNRDIRPLLAENCFACHGTDSATREAGLRLDQRAVAIEMGAIDPGSAAASELMSRVMSDDADLLMPPPDSHKRLTAEQKELLRRWIDQGAEYQLHWSFLPPDRPSLPPVSDSAWSKNEIDFFVLAELDRLGLSPASDAESAALFRRLHLDITGLPPAPGDAQDFIRQFAEQGDVALEAWIDRLMHSAAWGEHRARYWLDAARYADTHGLHFDNYREMWPYRDWVIRAFNANQPFDQFTVEQFAGDLLPDPTDDQLIATGFQRCNITTNEGGTIDEENLALYASDRVQTLGWVYLGLTTNCAQCHDHKFDPISIKDYYSLAAYFRNTTQPAKDGNVKDGRSAVLVVPAVDDRARWDALPQEIETAIGHREARASAAREAYTQWLDLAASAALEQAIPTEDMVVHVPLDDGEGSQAANRAGSRELFSATGEVQWVEDGKIGPAPVLKLGSTFDLGTTIGDFELDEAFSYGAWIRVPQAGGSGGIIARMDEKAAYRGWDLWLENRKIAVHLIDSWPDNALKIMTQGDVVKPGSWQHVWVTYDGSHTPAGVKIYIDGDEQAVRPATDSLQEGASLKTDTPLRIGQRSDGQAFSQGNVQDVRIYRRTLSAAEVQAIAHVAPLKTILSVRPEKRTAEQESALFQHYLLTADPSYPGLSEEVARLQREQQAIKERSPITHIQQEKMDAPAMANILNRGQYDQVGEEVGAATPPSLHPFPADAPPNRLGLAQWLVDPANPLTARVTVNRFWQELFGRGLVVTTEDFGVMGSPPSHPELLDWLAVDFRESGWDVQRFFKQIFLSATYRQAATLTPEKLELDRDNIYLSRGPRFRMDAEMIRDTALASSGLLSNKLYGPGVKPYQPENVWEIVGLPGGDTRNYQPDSGEALFRRSLYTFWKRMAPPPALEAFNAPSRELCVVRRERTNTPLQALVTLNDPQFVEAARHLAASMLAQDRLQSTASRLEWLGWQVLGRPLVAQEIDLLSDSQQHLQAYYTTQPEQVTVLLAVGEHPSPQELDPCVLASWSMVCSQLMNLDEALCK